MDDYPREKIDQPRELSIFIELDQRYKESLESGSAGNDCAKSSLKQPLQGREFKCRARDVEVDRHWRCLEHSVSCPFQYLQDIRNCPIFLPPWRIVGFFKFANVLFALLIVDDVISGIAIGGECSDGDSLLSTYDLQRLQSFNLRMPCFSIHGRCVEITNGESSGFRS
jgi:hypothetical protein